MENLAFIIDARDFCRCSVCVAMCCDVTCKYCRSPESIEKVAHRPAHACDDRGMHSADTCGRGVLRHILITSQYICCGDLASRRIVFAVCVVVLRVLHACMLAPPSARRARSDCNHAAVVLQSWQSARIDCV